MILSLRIPYNDDRTSSVSAEQNPCCAALNVNFLYIR